VIDVKCPFCRNLDTVKESELSFAIFDKHPVSRGHLLIITKRHISSIFEASSKEKKDLFKLLENCKDYLDEQYKPSGYNIGINQGKHAGQTIRHLHIHLIPRYKGDIEDPTGGIRGVIPQKRIYPAK